LRGFRLVRLKIRSSLGSGIVRRKSISDISNTSLKVLFNANRWSEMWHWRESDAKTHRTPQYFVQNDQRAYLISRSFGNAHCLPAVCGCPRVGFSERAMTCQD
jgi:hypothetical protein